MKPMPRFCVRFASLLVVALFCIAPRVQADPAWWAARSALYGVSSSGSATVTVQQLYSMAIAAQAELDYRLPSLGGSGTAVASASSAIWQNPPQEGLRAEYFNNQELSGTPVREQMESVNLYESPGGGVDAHGFSARWSGTVTPDETGLYMFELRSQGGGARLWINSEPIADWWGSEAGGSGQFIVTLTGEEAASVTLEYWASDDSGSYPYPGVQLRWSPAPDLESPSLVPTGSYDYYDSGYSGVGDGSLDFDGLITLGGDITHAYFTGEGTVGYGGTTGGVLVYGGSGGIFEGSVWPWGSTASMATPLSSSVLIVSEWVGDYTFSVGLDFSYRNMNYGIVDWIFVGVFSDYEAFDNWSAATPTGENDALGAWQGSLSLLEIMTSRKEQAREIAALFRARLSELGYEGFPGDISGSGASELTVDNLKALFDFDLEYFDSDLNGLPDWWESTQKGHLGVTLAESYSIDTDTNGLPDWWEYINFGELGVSLSTANAIDSDTDGLPDWLEAKTYGHLNYTGAQVYGLDSDADTISDWWEYSSYQNLTTATSVATVTTSSTDDDSIPDWWEYTKTGTTSVMTNSSSGGLYYSSYDDNDGISDWWEYKTYQNLTTATSAATTTTSSTDGDDIPDWWEYTKTGTTSVMTNSSPGSYYGYTVIDVDSDKISDWWEYQTYQNLTTAAISNTIDSADADYLPTWWEMTHFGSVDVVGTTSATAHSAYTFDDDADGISDWWEYQTYHNLTTATSAATTTTSSTDGDLIPDWWEYTRTGSTSVMTATISGGLYDQSYGDADGISDWWEYQTYQNLTTATSAATTTTASDDSDDIPDWWEYTKFGNLTTISTSNSSGYQHINADNDGIAEWWEYQTYQNLTTATSAATTTTSSTDGDGIPDWWEYTKAGNLTTISASNPGGYHTENDDNDGISDWWEYQTYQNLTTATSAATTTTSSTDGDDIPDWWEYTKVGNLTTISASNSGGYHYINDDYDKISDWWEYQTYQNLTTAAISNTADGADADYLPTWWEMTHFGNEDDVDTTDATTGWAYGYDDDADGISDWWEYKTYQNLTTAAISNTTDGADADYLPTWWEITHFGHDGIVDNTDATTEWAYSYDDDADGISDWWEYKTYQNLTTAIKTDDTDTDSDGVPDWWEITRYGNLDEDINDVLEANTVDTDSNDLPDWWEYKSFGHLGVTMEDANEVDTDTDGIPDWWEYVTFGTLDTTRNDAYAVDLDGNGLADIWEILLVGHIGLRPNEVNLDGSGLRYFRQYERDGLVNPDQPLTITLIEPGNATPL
jgi:hypothetical protein